MILLTILVTLVYIIGSMWIAGVIGVIILALLGVFADGDGELPKVAFITIASVTGCIMLCLRCAHYLHAWPYT